MGRARAIARWLLPVVVAAALVFFVVRYWDVIAQAAGKIRAADPAALAVACVAAAVAIAAMAEVNRSLLAAGGVRVPLRSCASLALAANAWSATLPGGQAFAALLSFNVMRSWGASALLCSWQIVLSATLSTMWLVALGVAAVFVLGASMSLSSLVATLAACVAVSWLVYLLAHRPELIIPVATWVQGAINSIRRRPRDTGVEELIGQIRQLDAVHLSPARFLVTSVFSLLNWVADVVVLWACVWAVQGRPPLWEAAQDETTIMGVVLAFVTSKIAGTVQATPGGIGPVEAALTGTLVAAGLPATVALGAALVFRVVTFFALVAIGWVVYALVYVDVGKTVRASRAAEGRG
ncbi:TIGR00374 family protein [Corynebacterium sp. 13CS0277]|uniref:lysylphosphatidylglycerol synthase transmembrane domain-containing protein n=1 Tax=Corynebacterium sp. 13CS0277 TaxID=2071994 RepID=UPI000D022E7A|nr:YbhN family protein [Corynebacterium sp. 13CS0277]PRQ11851.1 TIGR00374 family protein [Corynebacterium sp. 13CS0277]